MAILREFRRRAKDVVAPVLGFCVVGYFAYHSVEGERGLGAWVRLTDQIAAARAQHEEVLAERQRMERRVSALRPGQLDVDMLDERARLMLNLGLPGEIVVHDRLGGR